MFVNSWKNGVVLLVAFWSMAGCGHHSSSSSPYVAPTVPTPVFVPVNPSLPVITAPNLTVSGGTGAGGAFVPGDTVTVVWNDSSTGIHNNAGVIIAGVTVDFSNFGGGIVNATDPGSIWTAVFTIPTNFVFGASNSLLIGATDSAGNTYTFVDLLGVVAPPAIPSLVPNSSATKQISFLGEQMIVNLMYFGCFLWGCLAAWAIVSGFNAAIYRE